MNPKRRLHLGLLALVAAAAVALPVALRAPALAGDTETPAAPYTGDPNDERERRAATSEASCVACHEKARPALVLAWRESAHARHDVGCISCHGKDHSKIFAQKGAVSAATCGGCHAAAAKGFAASGHARAHDDMVRSPRFRDEPGAFREATCVACHRIGERDAVDGSAGRCDSCHPGHVFSAAAARRPEACASCHSGPEHPQVEAFAASRHGALLAAGGAPARSSATCASCHMSGGTHDTSAVVTDVPGLDEAQRLARRGAALASCAPCHATRFSSEALARGDAVRAEAEAILAAARSVIEALARDGLLATSTALVETRAAVPSAQVPSAPAPSSQGAPSPTPPVAPPPPAALAPPSIHGRMLALGEHQLQHAGSAIERRYFEMWRNDAPAAWKAIYHQAPAVARAGGTTRLRDGLAWITEEAARVRRAARAGGGGADAGGAR